VIAATDRVGNVFWRDSNTGTLVVWEVFGFGVVTSANLGAVPLNWVIGKALVGLEVEQASTVKPAAVRSGGAAATTAADSKQR